MNLTASVPGNVIQLGVGGLTLPPKDQWIVVTERLRGRAVRELCRALTGDAKAHYGQLTGDQRAAIALVSGKDEGGRPLRGHQHAYFVLWPDENDQPGRLVVWRSGAPFDGEETRALLRAAEEPLSWASNQIYLVPLPLGTSPPRNFAGPARAWQSATPFVPPSNRHRFRKGRLRNGEGPERLVGRLLSELGFPVPQTITASPAKASRLHSTRTSRIAAHGSSPRVRPAYNMVIRFPEPVPGPIVMGDSAHFGLGAFRAAAGTEP